MGLSRETDGTVEGLASTKSTVKISDSEVRSSTCSGNFEVVLKKLVEV